MVRKFGGERVECHVCKERVYPLEACKFDSFTYHKTCMRCTHCDGKVGLKGLAMIGDKIYCKPHFKELFKSTGGSYDAFDDIISQKGSTDTVTSTTTTTITDSTTSTSGAKDNVKEDVKESNNNINKPPMSPTKSPKPMMKPTKSPMKPKKSPMKSPKPSSTTTNTLTKSPGPHSLKKKVPSPTARDVSVEVPLWSPTPKKPCISPLTGEQIIPPSEERIDESEFALTLKEIKTKPHRRPSIIKLDVPKHENENEYSNTLKSIKKDATIKKLKSKKDGKKSSKKKKAATLATIISESDAIDFWLVVEKGNLDSLKEALKDINNVKVLFIKNDNGQTPIEYVFSSNKKKQSSNNDNDDNDSNNEFTYCGRYMMEYIQNHHVS